jgi:hypothetical protein
MGEGEGTGPHEQVVTSLLDLQARLRGEEPPEAPPEQAEARSNDILVLPEAEAPADPVDPEERTEFAPVTSLRTSAAGEDRLGSLVERIFNLESSLAAVAARAEQRETERIDRLVALEQRLLHEVASQRRDLLGAIDDRFVRLDAALREGLAELNAEPPLEEQPDEPA